MRRVVVMVALTIAAAASAQQRDTLTDTTRRPFVRGGTYDKPFQTRLLGRTAIGGYAEAHARWTEVDGVVEDAGFEAKRFNLFTHTRVSDLVRIGAEIEIEEGGKELKLEYAAMDLLLHPSFAVRGGMILSPLGRFNLAHDSPLNEFTDRPLVSTELLGVALSEPGFGVLGQFGLRGGARLTYEAYATNGFHAGMIDASDAGTRIPLGRGNVEDNNGSPAFVARLAWSPGVNHEIGVSSHRGAWNQWMLDGAKVDDRRDVSIAVLDLETRVLGTTLSGEFAAARVDVPDGLVGIYAESQRGWFLEGVREFGGDWLRALPDASFALKARWDFVDFDAGLIGDHEGRVTTGVTFRPTRDSAVKLDYGRGRTRDRFNNLGESAFFLLSIATYF